MSATPIQYQRPIEFTCKCGAEYCVDVDISAGFPGPFYKHCNEDEGRRMPGPLIAVSERRNGLWVSVEKF
jgi:hypothetical protein